MGKMQGEFSNGGPGQAPPPPPPQGAPPAADQSYQQMMQNRVDQMRPAAAPSGAGSGGGGYSLDPDEMQGLIGEWDKVLQKLDEVRASAQNMVFLHGPANEDASNQMATSGLNSARAYLRHNQEMHDYAVAQKQHLTDALNAYNAHDQNSADALNAKHA